MIFFTIIFLFQFPPIGSHPDSWEKYKENIDEDKHTFRCFDDSTIISLDKLNDNYLDCPDGSDEPGTNAFQNGTFYCHNLGIFSKIIPKWSVGDGICDCCDGSDEFYMKSKWKCPDKCQEQIDHQNQLKESLKIKVQNGLKMKADMKRKGELFKVNIQKRYNLFKKPLSFIDFLISKVEQLNLIKLHDVSQTKFNQIIYKIWNLTFSPPKNRENIFPSLSTALSKNLKGIKTFIISYYNLEAANLSDLVIPEALSLYNEEFKKSDFTLHFLRDIRQPHNLVGLFQNITDDMIYFDNGDHCWRTNRGRDFQLQLICNDKNGLVNVEEPEICVYQGIFASPIGCNENDLQELNEMNITELEELESLLDF